LWGLFPESIENLLTKNVGAEKEQKFPAGPRPTSVFQIEKKQLFSTANLFIL
jgi:hypothetical protein